MSGNEWDDVFSPDFETVRRLLKDQFPGLVGAGIEPIGEGFDCVAYRVGKWVFRFPRRPFGVKTLTTEAEVLPQLGFEVLLGCPARGFPHLFLGTPFQTGVPLEDYRGPRSRLAYELGSRLAELHSSEIPPGVPPDPIGKFHMPRRRSLIKERLGYIPPWAPRESPSKHPDVLLHGDVYCRHIYVSSEGGLAGLIDWGDVSTGHPAADLSCAWCCFDSSDREHFWQAYGKQTEELLLYARFRALYHTLLVRHYARDKGSENLLRESEEALERVLY